METNENHPETQPETLQNEAPVRTQERREAPRKRPAADAKTAGRRPVKSETAEKAKRPRRPEEGTGREAPRKTREQDGQKRKPVSRGTEEPRRRKKPAPSKKVKQEEGYQPYKAANMRKKAQQRGKIKEFFSLDNPILARFGVKGSKRDAFAEDSELGQKRRARREAEEEKKRKRKTGFNAPAVVYTQPQAFNRDRLLVQLITVIAVVLAFVLGLSVFFKVKVITITGAEVYSPWTIREASGIKEGDNLLTFGRARASGQITANLPYVKSVRIGIKLPDTVNIEIDEENVVYAIKSEEGIWWLINSDGKVVDMSNNAQAKNYTQVLGVTLTEPKKNEMAVPSEPIPTETGEDGEYVPMAVTGAQRLNAALQILKALEANDIVGEAASVDVSRMEDITLWYGSRYQVNLGDTSRIDYKIACMYDAILQMSDYETGIMDVSFTTFADQVAITPFQ